MTTSNYESFLSFTEGILSENSARTDTLTALDWAVLTTVFLVHYELDGKTEFEFNKQSMFSTRLTDGRISYPTLSFTNADGKVSLSFLHLFPENATIHAIFKGSNSDTNKLTTLHLNPLQYVDRSLLSSSSSSSIPINQRNYTQLNHLLHTVLFPHMQSTNKPPRPQFSSIPESTLLSILSYTSPKDICHAGQSCQRIRVLYQDDLLWEPWCVTIKEELKRCLEQKRFRRRSRFGHYHADPTFAFNNAPFVIQHTPSTITGTTAGTVASVTNTPVMNGTTALTTTTLSSSHGSSSSSQRNRYYMSYKTMALEIKAAEYFLPKGRASLYPPFGQSSSGWMIPGMMSGHRQPGTWPPMVTGEDGLYIGFNDRISHGAWLNGPRTATMPYGSTSNSMTVTGLGEGLVGSGLAFPRGTPNPYTLGHPLSTNGGLGSSHSSSNDNNHYPV